VEEEACRTGNAAGAHAHVAEQCETGSRSRIDSVKRRYFIDWHRHDAGGKRRCVAALPAPGRAAP